MGSSMASRMRSMVASSPPIISQEVSGESSRRRSSTSRRAMRRRATPSLRSAIRASPGRRRTATRAGDRRRTRVSSLRTATRTWRSSRRCSTVTSSPTSSGSAVATALRRSSRTRAVPGSRPPSGSADEAVTRIRLPATTTSMVRAMASTTVTCVAKESGGAVRRSISSWAAASSRRADVRARARLRFLRTRTSASGALGSGAVIPVASTAPAGSAAPTAEGAVSAVRPAPASAPVLCGCAGAASPSSTSCSFASVVVGGPPRTGVARSYQNEVNASGGTATGGNRGIGPDSGC